MKKISEKILYQGKWLSVHQLNYENKHGENIAWETVRRQKSRSGVVIVARMKPSDRFIIIKQFRPAVGGYILGFPAGLAQGDPAHALVELKEETGYFGNIISFSPPLKTGTSIIDDNGQIVLIEVDESDPRNLNPQQALEPGEDIEVCCIHRRDMKDFLLNQHNAGVSITSSLWYLFVVSELLQI